MVADPPGAALIRGRNSRVGSTASRKRRSCETTTSAPSHAASACSSCSIASRSRWFVGSSRTSRLTSRAWSSARCARVRSPGESVVAGAADLTGAETELGEQRSGVHRREPGSLDELLEQCGARRVRRALLADHADDDAASDPRASPATSGPRRCSALTRVVLPEPFRPATASRSPGCELEVERPEPERAALRRPRRRARARAPGAGRRHAARVAAPRARTASPAAGSARAGAPPGAPSSAARSSRAGRATRLLAQPAPPRARFRAPARGARSARAAVPARPPSSA